MPKYIVPKTSGNPAIEKDWQRRVRIPVNDAIMEYMMVGKKVTLKITGKVKLCGDGTVELSADVVECEHDGMSQKEYEKRGKRGTYA